MQCVHSLIKTTIPNYLSGLPIPNSIGGWFKLGCMYCTFDKNKKINFENKIEIKNIQTVLLHPLTN